MDNQEYSFRYIALCANSAIVATSLRLDHVHSSRQQEMKRLKQLNPCDHEMTTDERIHVSNKFARMI
jgi:hypothetical protein